MNAIELRFPGPVSGALDSTAGTELLPHGSIIQFISSQGSFRETVPYALRFELNVLLAEVEGPQQAVALDLGDLSISNLAAETGVAIA